MHPYWAISVNSVEINTFLINDEKIIIMYCGTSSPSVMRFYNLRECLGDVQWTVGGRVLDCHQLLRDIRHKKNWKGRYSGPLINTESDLLKNHNFGAGQFKGNYSIYEFPLFKGFRKISKEGSFCQETGWIVIRVHNSGMLASKREALIGQKGSNSIIYKNTKIHKYKNAQIRTSTYIKWVYCGRSWMCRCWERKCADISGGILGSQRDSE